MVGFKVLIPGWPAFSEFSDRPDPRGLPGDGRLWTVFRRKDTRANGASSTITEYVPPWSKVNQETPGQPYCFEERPGTVQYEPDRATYLAGLGFSPGDGVIHEQSATRFYSKSQSTPAATERTLSEEITGSVIVGKLRSIAEGLEALVPQIRSLSISSPGVGPHYCAVRCNGTLSVASGASTESHRVFQAFTRVDRARGPDQNDSGNFRNMGFRECSFVRLYIGAPGRQLRYCLVERRNFVIGDLSSGDQTGCGTHEASGEFVIDPPECEVAADDRSATKDFYSTRTFESPPSCCGLAP